MSKEFQVDGADDHLEESDISKNMWWKMTYPKDLALNKAVYIGRIILPKKYFIIKVWPHFLFTNHLQEMDYGI